MAGEAFRPAPSKISNRGLIARMKQWGWKEEKPKGDYLSMRSPTGQRVLVRSPHQHTGNSKETLHEVLEAMGGISWDHFIGANLTDLDIELGQYIATLSDEEVVPFLRSVGTAMQEIKAVDKEIEAAIHRADAHQRKEARRKAREEQRQEQHVTAQPAPVTPIKKPRNRGISNRVYDLLATTGHAMSLQAIASALGDITSDQAGNACANLMEAKAVQRVKHGVYQVLPQHQRQDVRVDVVARNEDTGETGEKVALHVPQAQPLPVVASAPEVPAPRPVAGLQFDYDESINDVLDLLFPQGFKAKHLPAIDAWRQATIALMREIGE